LRVCGSSCPLTVAQGSTLKVQDRAKFKATVQDLKDYEVYREVMESAMIRMQNEMDTIEKENQVCRWRPSTSRSSAPSVSLTLSLYLSLSLSLSLPPVPSLLLSQGMKESQKQLEKDLRKVKRSMAPSLPVTSLPSPSPLAQSAEQVPEGPRDCAQIQKRFIEKIGSDRRTGLFVSDSRP
jgi:hypothetical protein